MPARKPGKLPGDTIGAEYAGCGFLVELSFLGGRRRLAPHPVHALIDYKA